MAEIHNLKELNALGKDLRDDDSIYFTTPENEFKYKVYSSCLFIVADLPNTILLNDVIFKDLNLNKDEKYKLAEKCYGYKTNIGNWPSYVDNDYPAAERLIREIYKMLDEINIKPITSRFEILDL